MDARELPDWAREMWAEAGEPDLESLGSVLDGKLLGRRPGLRKDDLIEIHLDARSFPSDADTVRRGRLISTGKASIELLDVHGEQRFIARDVIVEVILIAHLRPGYLDDEEMHDFERDDMKRRRELAERSDITDKGDDHGFWG